MESIDIRPDAEVSFPDLDPNTEQPGLTVGGLARGTAAGKPTVFIALTNLEGDVVAFGQTTLALFLSAADALKAKHGDPRE